MSVGEEGGVVGLVDDLLGKPQAGRFLAAVSEEGETLNLVERDPVFDLIAVGLDNRVGIVSECICGAAVAPATEVVFKRLGEIPVKHGDPRGEAMIEHRVEQTVIEIDSLLVYRTAAGRIDAGPGERESVVFGTELRHEGQVFFEEVIVIAGDVEVVAVFYLSGLAGKGIPDGGAFAVGERGSLDLWSGGGESPDEVFGKVERAVVDLHVGDFSESRPRRASSSPPMLAIRPCDRG